MKKKLVQCSKCGKRGFVLVKEEELSVANIEKLEGILEVLKSHKTPYEKKIALFDYLKSLEVGEFSFNKEPRINYLLQSRLYNELARKSMQEYKKSTVEEFNKSG
jgi:hypothetical protein